MSPGSNQNLYTAMAGVLNHLNWHGGGVSPAGQLDLYTYIYTPIHAYIYVYTPAHVYIHSYMRAFIQSYVYTYI